MTISLAAISLLASAAVAAPPAPPQRMRVFYFGNSLTENTIPSFHTELGKSAGKDWTCAALVDGGAPLFHLLGKLEQDGWMPGGRAKQVFTQMPWDAITLQPSTWIGLERKGSETAGWIKDPERQVGDIASASGIIDAYLKVNANGQVLIYEAWPGIFPKDDPRTAGQPRPPPGVNAPGQKMAPDKASFDYQTHWVKTYDPTTQWRGGTWATRDYSQRLMEALKKKYEALWTSKRLGMIPVGEVFFALDKKFKAGKLPGVGDIEDFYTDVIHLRSGLPRYTVAATFYAVLFREHPGKLDWKIYNDRAKYGTFQQNPNPMQRVYVHEPDLGEHFTIDAERAKLVNDTIWEVVTAHPYTHLGAGAK